MLAVAATLARISDAARSFATRIDPGLLRETPEPRLKIWTSTITTPPTPWISEPMIYLILQGQKIVQVGGQELRLGPGELVGTSFGLPFMGHVTAASPTVPYLALSLDLDVDLMMDVMLDMPPVEKRWVCSAAVHALDVEVGESLARLVALLAAPQDRQMLWRHREVELCYRLLQSPLGETLRQLDATDEPRRQIKAVTDWLMGHAKESVSIGDLAARAGMSVTSFHRHFRAITGSSPLAFQKQLRLVEARRLLEAGGLDVTRTAFAVGYKSASQFTREYKARFGHPPATDRRSVGARLVR